MQLDEYGRAEEHRLLWREPTTLAGLGELMARWLEGDITYQPGYNSTGPDAETTDLIPVLAAVNRAGMFTTFSQPGVPLTDGNGQRAAIEGFCTEEAMQRLYVASWATDLVTLSYPPGSSASDGAVAVSTLGGLECTWLGSCQDRGELIYYYGEDLCEAAVIDLCSAWQVHILDPVWGRNDLLWDVLRRFAGEKQ
jgi:uncharacterized protein DUF6919